MMCVCRILIKITYLLTWFNAKDEVTQCLTALTRCNLLALVDELAV